MIKYCTLRPNLIKQRKNLNCLSPLRKLLTLKEIRSPKKNLLGQEDQRAEDLTVTNIRKFL